MLHVRIHNFFCLSEKCPNLVEYCERIKDTYWPDWDEYITHGRTRPALK